MISQHVNSITQKLHIKDDTIRLHELTELINKAEFEAKKKNVNVDTILDAADIGVWEWIPTTDSLTWNDKMFEIFEIDVPDRPLCYDDFLNCLHPDDRGPVDAACRDGAKGLPYFYNYRVRRRDGTYKRVYGKGSLVINGVTKLVGICMIAMPIDPIALRKLNTD